MKRDIQRIARENIVGTMAATIGGAGSTGKKHDAKLALTYAP